MKESTKEAAILGLTGARLLQAANLYRRVKAGKPVHLVATAIMGVDLGDGVIARKLGVDGPKRRLADSTVDAVMLAAGLASTYQVKPKARPYLGLLAAREAFVAAGWVTDLLRSKQPKKGDDFHKLASVSVAAALVAANHYSERAMKVTSGVAIAVNTALAFDYFKGWTDSTRNRILDSGVAEVPGFYEPRAAINRLVNVGQLQLESGSPQPQLEAGYEEPFIEGTCIEIE